MSNIKILLLFSAEVPVTDGTSAIAMIGGYIIRVLGERECCHECCTRLKGQQSRERLFSLIKHIGINYVLNTYNYFIDEDLFTLKTGCIDLSHEGICSSSLDGLVFVSRYYLVSTKVATSRNIW